MGWGLDPMGQGAEVHVARIVYLNETPWIHFGTARCDCFHANLELLEKVRVILRSL